MELEFWRAVVPGLLGAMSMMAARRLMRAAGVWLTRVSPSSKAFPRHSPARF